jgi:hypothetical protein
MTPLRRARVCVAAGLAFAVAFAVGTVGRAQVPSCDRACLRSALDAYLNAVIKHDPASAPLMIGFRQTENSVVVRPGSGLWKTMTGLGAVQRRYLDPVTGQAAYFGLIFANLTAVTAGVDRKNRPIPVGTSDLNGLAVK